MNVEKRMEIERKVVRHLIRTMKAHGWNVSRIDDGGEPDEDILDPNESDAMDAVFAVDAARIYFRKILEGKNGMTHSVYIVLGNNGYDAINDHTCGSVHPNDDFEKVMDEEVAPYCEKLEEAVC